MCSAARESIFCNLIIKFLQHLDALVIEKNTGKGRERERERLRAGVLVKLLCRCNILEAKPRCQVQQQKGENAN